MSSSTTPLSPTTELEAVNIMLSGIGEAPVNSFAEVTADVSMARHTLSEVSKELQLEGWQWNTEDDYPLVAEAGSGFIRAMPPLVRVHFRDPDARELTLRGDKVYDRVNHTFVFAEGTVILCTVTLLLPFDQMPEAARRYATLKALRIFQERVVGSGQLSQFQQADEARARVQLLGEERRLDRPNMLTGTRSPGGTWVPATATISRMARR